MPREDTLRYARGTSASALTLLNIFLLVALGSQQELSFIGMRHKCATERTPPPYSPVREDGFVRYVNKRFTPSKLFQFGPSDEVEEAGNETLAFSTSSANRYSMRRRCVDGLLVESQLHIHRQERQEQYLQKFPSMSKVERGAWLVCVLGCGDTMS
ncbi:hypothetical protein GX48_08298 [Paracoccidioides brasiliensis]|nr:hypothetical protein GX48_08298 [Paracoccidioides brasiliensis]